MAKILLENHQFRIKVEKLIQYADELGIYISNPSNYGIVLTDMKDNGKEYKLKPSDGSSDCFDSFPPQFDYNIIIGD